MINGDNLKENQIVVYENGEVEIKVSLDNQNETIWANVKEIAQLFNIDRTVVSRHIKNIFKDGELDEKVVCANFAYTTQHGALNSKTQTRMVKYYNLDIILAVGYRTNSKKAIEFRKWATKILKLYIINGYAINSEKITVDRFLNLEKDVISIKNDMQNIKKLLPNEKLELQQGIFYNGQIFDAYVFVNNLLKTATKEVILIDGYIDETVLTLFSKYPDLQFRVITQKISKQLKLDIEKYNFQYNNLVVETSNKFHDRFLLIDNKDAYHIGASLKDLGKRVFAFNKIDIDLIKKGIMI